jgi:hypothetical protein
MAGKDRDAVAKNARKDPHSAFRYDKLLNREPSASDSDSLPVFFLSSVS